LLTGEENFLCDAPLRQLLISYGLTKNQARILCILNQNKTHLSVKQISHLSNIARESIYQVLFDLKEKGLIEKAITTPKKYKAIPLKTILQILTKQVLFNHNNILENDNITERFQYVLVPKKRQFIERINHTIFNSKEKVRIKTHLKRYLQAVNMHKEMYQESFTNAIHNGVRFQVIIGLESKEEKIPEEIKLLSKSQNISVKLDDTAPAMAMAIMDEKEIFLINEPSSNLEESSALWSNNHILVEVLSTCFDSFWKKASSITH
jgi:sugar-specific transcriptional regulator TrmB